MKKLYYAVLAVLASIMMPACREANPETPEPGIGLQMYSVRGLTEKTGDAVLFPQIAGMGYSYIEACTYADGKFSGKSPEEFRASVEAAGLSVLSSHCSIGLSAAELKSKDFSPSLEKWLTAIKAHKAAGIENVIQAWIQAPGSLEEWQTYCDYFNAVGALCRDEGLRFGYHNHWFEFEPIEGVLPYDYLLEHTNSKLVFMELDAYWMISRDQDPLEWFARYPGRFRMLHIKDKTYVGSSMDFTPIMEARKSAGVVNTIIEAEWYGEDSEMETVSKSIVTLRSIENRLENMQDDSTVCVLTVFDMDTHRQTEIARFPFTIEAPNWTPDGKWLIYNSKGLLYRIPSDGSSEPELINTGRVNVCNNDHCLSFDGKMIGISSGTKQDWRSHIYVCPVKGGEPVEVTPVGPSYLHGWSPDGKYLVYCADRNGEYDVYRIPVEGGDEIRLTTAPGLDDGPEYTPDGNWIWFNSVRSGMMQLWRMRPDGSDQQQMTFDDDRNAWFGHVSPDGTNVVYITYWKGDLEPGEHLGDRNVELRVMPANGGESTTLVALYGGQGTINVNSWSPDSRRFAFVSFIKR